MLWIVSKIVPFTEIYNFSTIHAGTSTCRIFSSGGQIRWSVGQKSSSGVRDRVPVRVWGQSPPRSWRHVWKIVHKYFVYWDFWQHLLVNNAEKKHFQLGQVSPLPMHASVVGYHGDVTIAVLDLLCAGRRFNCQPFHFQVTTLGKLFTSGIIC